MGNGPQKVVPALAATGGAASSANKKAMNQDNPNKQKPEKKVALYKAAGSKISQAGTRLTELRCLETQLMGMMPAEGTDSQKKVADGMLPA